MFTFIPNGRLAVRFYGSDYAVITRRDGRRTYFRGAVSEFLQSLLAGNDPPLLEETAARFNEAPHRFQETAKSVRMVLDSLDRAKISDYGDILRGLAGFAQFAIDHRLPLFSLVEITYSCNLRCDHCYVLDKVSEPHPHHLSEATAAKVIDALCTLGCLDITLSGGETTLHPGYRRFITRAKDRHLHTTLKTNGLTMSPKLAHIYAEDPAHETHLSLYGSTADVHDAMTTVPGSFDKTMAGLRALADFNLSCKVNVTVWQRNHNQLGEIRKLVEDLGHKVNFDAVIFGRLNGDRAPLQYRISANIREQLEKEGFLRPFAPSPCAAGMLKLKIGADGAVRTCELLPEGFGDVNREDLADIWRADAVADYGHKVMGLSVTKRPSDNVPVRSCPGLNVLNTGTLHGLTVIS